MIIGAEITGLNAVAMPLGGFPNPIAKCWVRRGLR